MKVKRPCSEMGVIITGIYSIPTVSCKQNLTIRTVTTDVQFTLEPDF